MARVYGDGLVNLSVGNITPGEAVTVWLELVAGVESREDGFRFRFPFTLAPAYHSQARAIENEEGLGELELPEDAFGDLILPAWAPNAEGLHRVGFDLKISLPGAITEVSSPSHPLSVRLGEAGQARTLLGKESDLPNRDLVLDVRGPAAKTGIFGGLDKEGRARMAAVIPAREFGERATGARRIVFLLDRSGSMQGPPIEQARRALAACLSVIEPTDEFAIVAFDDTVESFRPKLSEGSSEAREAAKLHLAGIDARGGTELFAGIQEGVRLLGGKGGEMLVLTDGQVAETEPIIQAARQAGVRIHCLGIGSASQDRFLALLAQETGGMSRFLTPRERVDMAALEMFAALGRPVAEKLRFEIQGLPGARIEPPPLETVYSGAPITFFARADGAGQGRLVATWEAGGLPLRREFPLSVCPDNLGHTLKLLQGARLIAKAQLGVGEVRSAGGKLAQRQEERADRHLKMLSLEYGLASRAMSLVAVLERPADRAGQLPETRVVPVCIPEDTAFKAYFEPPMTKQALCWGPISSADQSLDMMSAFDSLDVDSSRSVANARRRRDGFFGDLLSGLSKPVTSEDTLMEMAARMESDGGLPGNDLHERVICTLVALLCFLGQGSSPGQGPFKQHLILMLKFLSVANPLTLGEPFERIQQQILEAAKAGEAIPGDWLKLARRLIIARKIHADKAWKEICRRMK